MMEMMRRRSGVRPRWVSSCRVWSRVPPVASMGSLIIRWRSGELVREFVEVATGVEAGFVSTIPR